MTDDQSLTPAEAALVREGIAAAVLGASPGLAESLEYEPAGYLRLVAVTRVGAEEGNRLLREAVAGARASGHSWDTVGKVLGVSRQAAQQRFAEKPSALEKTGPGAREARAGGAERRVLAPLNAFDEMAALEQAGLEGWELVDYGVLHHVVQASDHRWEHRRAVLATRRRRLEADGWIPVGDGYFPWSYYKRPLADD